MFCPPPPMITINSTKSFFRFFLFTKLKTLYFNLPNFISISKKTLSFFRHPPPPPQHPHTHPFQFFKNREIFPGPKTLWKRKLWRGGDFAVIFCLMRFFHHEHILDQHNEAEHSYFCNICDRSFLSEDALNQHNNAKHRHHCYECNMVTFHNSC